MPCTVHLIGTGTALKEREHVQVHFGPSYVKEGLLRRYSSRASRSQLCPVAFVVVVVAQLLLLLSLV